MDGQSCKLKAFFDEFAKLVQVGGPVAQLLLVEAPFARDAVISKLILDKSLGGEKGSHKFLFFRRRIGITSGVKLLVQQVNNRHVVVNVQIVEKRFSNLEKSMVVIFK